MDKQTMIQHLKDAIGTAQSVLPAENRFKKSGFDGSRERLGWAKVAQWEQVEKAVKVFLDFAEGKEEFIFVGMGGSANGIKTLIELSRTDNIYALDSLDPAAFDDVLQSVKDIRKTLVVPISKSGTTKETQLISNALRNVFGSDYDKNFLWIGDPEACDNLDKLGWEKADKINIQVDGGSDVGGRFSSPQTLVFLAPLALILDRDTGDLKKLWSQFSDSAPSLLDAAAEEALKYKDSRDIRLCVQTRKDILEGFSNWVIQLFQESIGSKDEKIFVKTLVTQSGIDVEGFSSVSMDDSAEAYVYVMKYMYFLQLLCGFIGYVKDICFVDQPYVEVYKKELKNLEGQSIDAPETLNIDSLIGRIKEKITPEMEFIDVVLFYHAGREEMEKIRSAIGKACCKKTVTVFIGSDWNHHSYQAAFGDRKTLFVIADRSEYSIAKSIDRKDADKCLNTLKAISFATYKTIASKSVYCCLVPVLR